MSYPTYYISSSVVNVNTDTTSKILMLPPANTIQGTPITIKDITGNAGTYNIWVSTQQFDLMDHYASTILLNNNYQSFSVVPWSTTRYAITMNYTQGLSPFLYAIYLQYQFTQRFLQRNWRGVASSGSGTILGAVISSVLYVSSDSGVSFTNTLTSAGGFNGLAISTDGIYMVAAADNSNLYVSSDSGLNWTARDSTRLWSAVACSSDGSIMMAVTNIGSSSDYVYVSTNYGVSWTAKGPALTSLPGCAMSSNGSVMYYTNAAGYIYVSTDTGNSWSAVASVDNWQNITCSADGTIAYASTNGGNLYKSADTGTTWTLMTSGTAFTGPACSSNGSIVIGATGFPGFLQASFDGGDTFKIIGDSRRWTDVCLNSSGNQLFACVTISGYLYTADLVLS